MSRRAKTAKINLGRNRHVLNSSLGVTPVEFRDEPDIGKNYRVLGSLSVKKSCLSLFIQYQCVTRRTDGRIETDRQMDIMSGCRDISTVAIPAFA